MDRGHVQRVLSLTREGMMAPPSGLMWQSAYRHIDNGIIYDGRSTLKNYWYARGARALVVRMRCRHFVRVYRAHFGDAAGGIFGGYSENRAELSSYTSSGIRRGNVEDVSLGNSRTSVTRTNIRTVCCSVCFYCRCFFRSRFLPWSALWLWLPQPIL